MTRGVGGVISWTRATGAGLRIGFACAVVMALGLGTVSVPAAQANTLVYDLEGRPVWVDRKRKKPKVIRRRPTNGKAAGSAPKAERQSRTANQPPKPQRRPVPKARDLFAAATPDGTKLPPVAPLEAGLTERTETAWSNLDIHKARAACNRALARISLKAKPLPPIKRGVCGDPAPIALERLDGKHTVTFKPAAKLNCAMVVALDKWLKTGLQPAAKRHLKARITEVSVMSDYSCRNAYGRKNGKLSEHGLANALDIGGFVTGDGKRTLLLSHWGPTEAEEKARLEAEAKAKARAAAAAKAAKEAAKAKAPSKQPAAKPSKAAPAARTQLLSRGTLGPGSGASPSGSGGTGLGFSANKLGGPPTSKSLKQAPSLFKTVDRRRMYFLKQAHRSACKIFGTVLGPEANDAHRNHFHVDLAPRKRRNYCR